jgi:hypothetical protein
MSGSGRGVSASGRGYGAGVAIQEIPTALQMIRPRRAALYP